MTVQSRSGQFGIRRGNSPIITDDEKVPCIFKNILIYSGAFESYYNDVLLNAQCSLWIERINKLYNTTDVCKIHWSIYPYNYSTTYQYVAAEITMFSTQNNGNIKSKMRGKIIVTFDNNMIIVYNENQTQFK